MFRVLQLHGITASNRAEKPKLLRGTHVPVLLPDFGVQPDWEPTVRSQIQPAFGIGTNAQLR